jgi:chloramphenicol-sensitive protein RarD
MADPEAPASEAVRTDALHGFLFALSAYLIWGFSPLLFKSLHHIPPLEVLFHRVIWSLPVAGLVLLMLGRTADIRAAFRSPRTLAMALVTTTLVSANWGIFIWAVSVDRTVEVAFGYYINPLLNIVIGVLLLGERFTPAQMLAIGLAASAVVLLTVGAGVPPWISLLLALTFAFYGYLRKTLPIGPSQGFFLEVMIMSVPAVLYVAALESDGTGHMLNGAPADVWLLMLCGPVTAIPLILYAFGAKLLRYSTIGLMQYIAPTIIFMLAVFVFREPFSLWQLSAFVLIWIALAIYSVSVIRSTGAS